MVKSSRPESTPTQRELLQHWRQWIIIVDQHTYRKKNARGVDFYEYEKLYQKLMVGCELFREVQVGKRSVETHRLLEIIRPWVSLHSLTKADRLLLFDLLSRSRSIDAELSRKKFKLGHMFKILVLLGLAVGVFLFGLRPDAPLILADTLKNLRILARHLDDPPFLVGLVIAIVAASIASISMASRR